MLHVVTDRDTDIVTSNLLSTWIPNEGTTPWSCVNVKEWIEKGISEYNIIVIKFTVV